MSLLLSPSSSVFLQQHLFAALQNSIRHVCEIDGGSNNNNNSSSKTSPSALLRILAALRVMLKHAGVFRAAARGSALILQKQQQQQSKNLTNNNNNSLLPLLLTPSRLLLCFDDEDEEVFHNKTTQQQGTTMTNKNKKNNRDDDDINDEEPSSGLDDEENDSDVEEEKIDHLLLLHEKSPHIRILSEICHSLGSYRRNHMMMKLSDYDAILEYDGAWRGGGSGRNNNTTMNTAASSEILSQTAHYVWSHAMIQCLRSSGAPSNINIQATHQSNFASLVELGQQDDLVLTDLLRKVNHKSVAATILMRELRRRLRLVIQKLEFVVDSNSSSSNNNNAQAQQQQQKAANDILLSIPIRLKQWATSSMVMKKKKSNNSKNSYNDNDDVDPKNIIVSKLVLQRCYNIAARVVELRSSIPNVGTNQKHHDQLKLARSVATTFQELAAKMK